MEGFFHGQAENSIDKKIKNFPMIDGIQTR
jgi:hypothetical protein